MSEEKTNLRVMDTEADRYRADAKRMLLEQAEKGYDRVVVLGYKDGNLHHQSSSTPNFLEDIGSMVVAVLERYGANAGSK